MPSAGARYPNHLSGGEQQRVALATSPGLLPLDEPLSALDAIVRLHLRHEIRALQRRLRVTTIMVTHDQEEALTMADRIVMNQGVINQVGSPREIYREPATAFSANFVGKANVLDGTVEAPGRVRIGRRTLACPLDGKAPGAAVRVYLRPKTSYSVGTPARRSIRSCNTSISWARTALRGSVPEVSGRP